MSSLALKASIASGGGGANQPLYVDDVFSTYLYTGNGSTQTINNGIDLAGEGGLVWIKNRGPEVRGHNLADTVRGPSQILRTEAAASSQNWTYSINAFNSNGFTVGGGGDVNMGDNTVCSWTFRKAPKFFDVVTYAGQNSRKTISHSLGIAPGMIILKCTSSSEADGWVVYHRSTGTGSVLKLNTTGAISSSAYFVSVTSTDFQLEFQPGTNASGKTYVAYLFAHDPSADGIIQCGSFTTDASGLATVNLGWEPQFVLTKKSSGANNWQMNDTMRGWTVGGTADPLLVPNSSSAENTSAGRGYPTATGFQYTDDASSTYIYMAIRRPNKPPTTGTQVYNAIASTGGSSSTPCFVSGWPVDFAMLKNRAVNSYWAQSSRLQGAVLLDSSSTSAESANSNFTFDYPNGFSKDPTASSNFFGWMFRRAPGFFSSFAYTGTGSNTTQSHDLAVVPDLLIVKSRSGTTDWQVWCNGLAANEKLVLNSTAGKVTDATAWNSTLPTSTNISLGTASATNANAATFIAYAFSNLPGIQKIGTYVGDGTSGRVIDCGFSTGARFVCIKAISTTGSWLVSDTARGITSGNDPYLALNSTAAEVTTEDWLDPSSIGFIVNNVASSNANTNGVTYMYWAIS